MTPKEKHDLAATFFAATVMMKLCLPALSSRRRGIQLYLERLPRSSNSPPEKFDEAELPSRIALSIDAHNAQAAFSLGALLHQQSRLTEALSLSTAGLTSPASAKAQWRSNFSQLTRSLRFLSPRSPPDDSKNIFVRSCATIQTNVPTLKLMCIAMSPLLQSLPEGNAFLRLLELGAAFHHLTPALKCCKKLWRGAYVPTSGTAMHRELVFWRPNDGRDELQVTADNFDLQSFPGPSRRGV